MSQPEVFQIIAQYRLIPLVTIDAVTDGVLLADALTEGGLPVAEIIFRTAAAPQVIRRAANLELPFVPGVATPSEIETAMGLGVEALKFFLAERGEGADMIKTLSAVSGHTGVQFVPTGGINQDNLEECILP